MCRKTLDFCLTDDGFVHWDTGNPKGTLGVRMRSLSCQEMFYRQLDFVCGAQKRDLGRDADLESASIKGAIKSWTPVR